MSKYIDLLKFGILCIVMLAFSCGSNVPKEVELAYQSLPQEVDFNFYLKPLLSYNCFSCHNPDLNTRQTGLCLCIEEVFKKLASRERTFVSGKPGSSKNINRILNDYPEIQIPPLESNLALPS